MITISRLQHEVGEWTDRNFPANTDNEPFCGIVEEVGELAAARLGIVAAAEEFRSPVDAMDDERDAIGDITVYLVDYCRRRGFDLAALMSVIGCGPTFDDVARESMLATDGGNPFVWLVKHVGELAHARLKAKQGIRGTAAEHEQAEQAAIFGIVQDLGILCQRRRLSYGLIVNETWEQVKQRDWTRNRVNGQAAAPAAAPAPQGTARGAFIDGMLVDPARRSTLAYESN